MSTARNICVMVGNRCVYRLEIDASFEVKYVYPMTLSHIQLCQIYVLFSFSCALLLDFTGLGFLVIQDAIPKCQCKINLCVSDLAQPCFYFVSFLRDFVISKII